MVVSSAAYVGRERQRQTHRTTTVIPCLALRYRFLGDVVEPESRVILVDIVHNGAVQTDHSFGIGWLVIHAGWTGAEPTCSIVLRAPSPDAARRIRLNIYEEEHLVQPFSNDDGPSPENRTGVAPNWGA